MNCPYCGRTMRAYDRVDRIVIRKYGVKEKTKILRYRCDCCAVTLRELPDWLLPFKHYDKNIIMGVVEGLITPETLGFEDYPCEITMKRWSKSTKL